MDSQGQVMTTYNEFIKNKRRVAPAQGCTINIEDIHPSSFPFQAVSVKWAVAKGRAALFLDTGLGKTRCQIEWARLVNPDGDSIILAPLSVIQQTIDEGATIGVTIHMARKNEDVKPGINICNYEMAGHLDLVRFQAVVLDESSLLKNFHGKTRTYLINVFADTPFKLCCTATPAPNDIAEIANHAEFLGIMKRTEMLATFFVHDDEGWRLKKHAHEAFYKWMASWALSIKRPSDIGFDDDGFILPPLNIYIHQTTATYTPAGMLPGMGVGTVSAIEAKRVRRQTIEDRVLLVKNLIAGTSDQWLVWCGLNDEAAALIDAIPSMVNLEGKEKPEAKARKIHEFVSGDIQHMVTKTSIAGFGVNMQRANKMIFFGMDYSWEGYYQAVRRMWRFGQKQPVDVHIIISDQEQAVLDSVMNKEREAIRMTESLIAMSREYTMENLNMTERETDIYQETTKTGQDWTLMLGDSGIRLKELADESVDFSVFSPPFATLYTYTNSLHDLGNCANYDEFFTQFEYITQEIYRAHKPGRLVAVHVQQLATQKARDGEIGMIDFRGMTIKHFQDQGFIYHGEVCIDKDPQAQAIRTKSKSLLFVQLHKDSSWLRPAFADYILLFRKPGDNITPILPDITNEEWIEWARPIWYNIRESDTLNAAEARGQDDERHICPLQLGTIERCIRLWSNPGELVLSPFAGIGSEGHEALRLGRKFIGVELKPEYYKVAIRNLENANGTKSGDLFAWADRNDVDLDETIK